MPTAVIQIEGVSKDYPIFSSPASRLKQLLSKGRRRYYRIFKALNEINLTVHKGETFGLLGENGSGKSTLLQIIAGIITPTSGSIRVDGRVAALLELGAGFNAEFTGRENIFLSASLLGLSHSEILSRYQEIIRFADIGEFIDRPVKTYSSGMFARLAFAVASSVSPDILIVDEILAVGDAKFQARCFARLRELRDGGTTIFFVSHSAEQVVQHCTRAAVLEHGNLVYVGEPVKAVNHYLDRLFGRSRQTSGGDSESEKNGLQEPLTRVPSEAPDRFKSLSDEEFSKSPLYNKYEHRWGDQAASILDFEVVNSQSEQSLTFKEGEAVSVFLKIRFNTKVPRPIYGFTVKTKEGFVAFGSNSEMAGNSRISADVEGGEIVIIKFSLTLSVVPGDYFISVGVASHVNGELIPHDRRYDSIHLNVVGQTNFYGLARLPFAIDKL
jgi:lipopolysaccharide transport system ATP-binding protein